MSELPKWIGERRRELYSCLYHPCKGCKDKEKETADAFVQALSIAWEALELASQEHSSGFGCAGQVIQAKDALRRIEEMGK